MKKTIVYLFLSFIIITTSFFPRCQRQKPENYVVLIDGRAITEDIFFSEYPKRLFAKFDQEKRAEKLDDFVNREVIYYDGIKKGYTRRKKISDQIEKRKRKLLFDFAVKKFVIDRVITEDDIIDTYNKLGKEVKASHILISYKGAFRSKSTRSEDEALQLARELVERARSGEDFGELAKKYSDGPSASKGGSLNYFSWGQMEKEFQEAAFNMAINEISDPIKTRYGYHIIKIDDIRKKEIGTLEEERSRIEKLLERTKRSEIIGAFYRFADQIKREKNTVFHKDAIARLAAFIKNYNTKTAIKPRNRRYADPVEALKRTTDLSPLVTVDGRDYNARWLANYLQENPVPDPLENKNTLTKAIDQGILEMLFVELAEKNGGLDDEELKLKLRKFEKNLVYQQYIEHEINSSIKSSQEELQKFYQEHPDLFKRPERREIVEVFIKNKDRAQELYERVKKGEDIQKIAMKYTERKIARKNNGVLGPFTRNKYGKIGIEAFKMAPGELHEPMKVSGGYSFFKLLNVLPEGVAPYDEVKARVKREYQKDRREKLLTEQLNKLKMKYEVEVNKNVINI